MTERKYNEDEMREIFALAAKGEAPGQRVLPSGDEGLSLVELQQIGREAGIEPALVAEAAMALEKRGAVTPSRRLLGMPVSVGRVAELPRAPTDREWEMIVAELRETFGARGRVESLVATRSWTNGNLHVYVEPSGAGHRLRMGTLKGNAVALNGVGVVSIITALIMGYAEARGGTAGLLAPALLGAAGVGALIANALRLPPWVRRREQQMDQIAQRAQRMLESPPAGTRTDA